MKFGDWVSLIFTVIPFLIGCVIVDAWQHYKGVGRVDKYKEDCKKRWK